ncbi:MAG: hypothetical protein ACOYNS_02285 [Bacteroidota bacterium]
MKKTTSILSIVCVLVSLSSLLLTGCEDKIDLLPFTNVSVDGALGDTSYVEKGTWSGIFNRPRTIIYGVDQLFYVSDTYNNRIIMLNQAGQVLSISKPIMHPTSIAQDGHLDLLVGAETIEPVTKDTIGVVLRIKLVPANHNLQNAVIDTVWREPARPKRRFVGIASAPNDEFLIARDGPDNSSPVDPDCRIMRFKYQRIDSLTYIDRYITPLSELQTGQGSSITSMNHITGIATFPNSADFIMTQQSEGIQYSAIWMVYSTAGDFQGWLPKYDPSVTTGVDFIAPNRFRQAYGIGIDRTRRDIFIVDAAQDSIVKFNSRGRFKPESFGAKTFGISLKNPGGVAVAENTLYVCDTDNNRIVLYRLSTDN